MLTSEQRTDIAEAATDSKWQHPYIASQRLVPLAVWTDADDSYGFAANRGDDDVIAIDPVHPLTAACARHSLDEVEWDSALGWVPRDEILASYVSGNTVPAQVSEVIGAFRRLGLHVSAEPCGKTWLLTDGTPGGDAEVADLRTRRHFVNQIVQFVCDTSPSTDEKRKAAEVAIEVAP